MRSARVLFWDFDGTLGERPGKWSGTLLEALGLTMPGHGFTQAGISPLLSSGFPWHDHQTSHPQLSDPETWWVNLIEVLTRALTGLGLTPHQARQTAGVVRSLYIDPARWRLFSDTIPALTSLAQAGWRHALISNHVPELAVLLDGLGISGHFDAVINSAVTGYEKPHPEAFRLALDAAGYPAEAWMIGDSITADVDGAEAAGIHAILVRTRDSSAQHQAHDLHCAAQIIETSDAVITHQPPARHRAAPTPANQCRNSQDSNNDLRLEY